MTERDHANTALEHFKSQNYDKCLEILTKFAKQDRTVDDPKVQHNLALTNYYLSNLTEPKKFLEELAKIKKKIDETLAEQESKTSNGVASTATGPTNTNAPASASAPSTTAVGPSSAPSPHAAPSSSSPSSPSGVKMEEWDTYLLSYNQAVISYQMKQFATTLSILEPLFQHIEPIDEQLALRICFLLIDTYLFFRQKDKISLVLGYLEKTFPHFVSETDPKKDPDNNQNRDNKENKGEEHEKKEATSAPSVPPMSTSEFKYNLHLVKAKLHLLNKSYKSSKKELKLAMSSNANSTSAILKAHVEYLQQNYNKSLKLLNNSAKQNSDISFPVLYFNNLGCIHVWMKKYHSASFYFSKALKQNELLFETQEPRRLTSFAKSRKMEILYNIGYQLLLTGNPDLAFQCFQEASLLFYKLPKIWIRLAECCIASHVKKIHDSRKYKNSLVRKVAAHGDARRIILPTTKGPKLKEDSTEISADDSNLPPGSIQNAAISLEFGAKSARNALFLLSRNASNLSEEELQMETCALVNLAYIALATHNPVVALSAARELLSKKICTDSQKLLGNVYAAEALCMLGRVNEAIDHLNPSTLGITDTAVNLPSSPYSSFSPDPSLNMKYTLFVNLAIVHIMKEDLVQAQQYLSQAMSLSRSTAALLLQVYLDLRKGNTDAALRLLKVGSNFAPGKSGE